MDKVKFGIIGCGNMGSAHARFFESGKIENGVLTAVADIDEKRLNALKAVINREDVNYFNSAEELIESGKCDAVIIAIPHYFHPKYSMLALENGLHVMCEKPEGVYAKQARELNEYAKKSDKLFGLMYNQRTNCVYRKMREMIENGELGELKRLNWIITNWYRPQSYYNSSDWRASWAKEGGGVLMNQCPHQLDLLQWIMGGLPTKVRAFCKFGRWHDIEVEDDVTAYMEFDSGATGCFVTCTADAPGSNRLEITGSKGSLLCERNGELIFNKLDIDEREYNRDFKGGMSDIPYKRIEVPLDGKNEQHVGILNNFANAILGKEKLYVSGEEGINCVQLINAMLLSTWLDKTVELPVDEELYLSELQKRIASSKFVKTNEEVSWDANKSFNQK